MVTGAFPAVVTVVVRGQRLSTVEGNRGQTLVDRCVPRCGDSGCERPAPRALLRVTGG